MLGRLADPRLTGMTSTELERLAAALAPAQAARTQQRHANSAAAEPGGQPETCAASHCSTTPHAC